MNEVFIVLATSGEHDLRETWLVGVYYSDEEARESIKLLPTHALLEGGLWEDEITYFIERWSIGNTSELDFGYWYRRGDEYQHVDGPPVY